MQHWTPSQSQKSCEQNRQNKCFTVTATVTQKKVRLLRSTEEPVESKERFFRRVLFFINKYIVPNFYYSTLRIISSLI